MSPTTDSPQSITSVLPLQFYRLDERGNPQKAGSAVASRSAPAPDSETWWIQPLQTLSESDWDAVLDLMREMRIPGLSVEGQMTDALLERLSRLDHLTYLGMEGAAEVTDAGLKHLARLPRLRHLDLSVCPQITDEALEVLRSLPQLRTFKMVHQNRVTDAGLSGLAHCPHLERVNLMGTRAGDGVVRALAGKPRLHEFYSGSEATDAALPLLHEFPVFKTWQGGEPSMGLMSFNAGPNLLFLRGSITDAGLAALAGLDGLFALNLDDSKLAVTAEGLRPLVDLPRLGWLAFDAEDAAMRYIGAMPRLRFLMCQDTVAGDDGFEALSRSQTLEYLWGRRCYNLTGRGFAALSTMPSLRGLSVSCKNVDDAGLSTLPQFPALTDFMPMDVPDDGFGHVGRCPRLEQLNCMYCEETTDAATEHLAGLSLKGYQAWSTRITDRSLEILGGMASLERITLYNCPGITDAGLASIAALPRLKEVILETLPNVTPEGVSVFPSHVAVNSLT